MLRCVVRKNVSAVVPLAMATRSYNIAMFKNPERRPQLSEEERAKVVVDQSQWPAEFKDFDNEDPYKYSPAWINLSSWSLFLWGVEVAFIYQFWELVFPKGI
jgi:hypothetical protein